MRKKINTFIYIYIFPHHHLTGECRQLYQIREKAHINKHFISKMANSKCLRDSTITGQVYCNGFPELYLMIFCNSIF